MLKILLVILAIGWPVAASAATHQSSVPLHDGRLAFADLEHCLARDLHLPQALISRLPGLGSIDLRGPGGWATVRGLNAALGDGFQLKVDKDSLVIQFDGEHLPGDFDAFADALLRFTEQVAPDAVARQNRQYGLFVPKDFDSTRHLVILIHGLDGDASCCQALANLLKQDGSQPAIFAYPAERPLAQSAKSLQQAITDLEKNHPGLKIDLVTESMGGLIAREFVEGPDYSGGIDHFIMIAPPNNGSPWAKYSIISKIGVDFDRYRYDPDWSFASTITEGLCQAGSDMKPGSKFLTELNSRPRRPGVHYTIVAGDCPIGYRFESEALAKSAGWIPRRISGWWGVRQLKLTLQEKSAHALTETGQGDGPIPVKNAALAGVDDFVVIHSDHVSLFEVIDDKPPAAWTVIKNRLEK